MKIGKARSIDELYERVRDYDLVLTVEAPLADALNNRLEGPRLGYFAITPKRLAKGERRNEDLADERRLFVEIARETDLSWKQAFYILENVIDCWEHSGGLRGILDYERFDNEEVREVIGVIEDTPNEFSAMESFEIDCGDSVAAIAPYQMNELDRSVLPEDYDSIGAFEEGRHELPGFEVFGTVTEILDTIRENVTEENADDVAIFTPPDSEYTPLLRSLFSSRDIPYMLGTDFAEDRDLRTVLLIAKSGLSGRRTTLRDVQPVLRSLGVNVSPEHNREFLEELDIDELDGLKDLLGRIEGSTFLEVIEEYEDMTGKVLGDLRENLGEIGILEDRVSEASVNRLEYYLDSFEIQTRRSRRGVLIASPKTSSFIDRPIVFYLGMDSEWEHDRPEKPWIDREDYEDGNLRDFQLLLQNGEERHLMVRDSVMGNRITPCLYFDELLEEDFEGFGDLPHEDRSGPAPVEAEGFERVDYGVEVGAEKTVSQSGLNRLVRCPKDYFFNQLVPMERNRYLRRGSLFHDFAEFYVNHPDFVEERGLEEFVEVMAGEMRPLVDDFRLAVLRTEYLIGLENIVEFLDGGVEDPDLSGYGSKSWENFFAGEFGMDVDRDATEAWFENPELGAKGKVDLIMSEDRLVDYKSGRSRSARSIVTSSNVDLFEEDPNFQAILYLAHHRGEVPGRELEFVFFHFLDNLDDVVSGGGELEDDLVSVRYYPRGFSEQVPREGTFGMLVEGVSDSNPRRKTLQKMGYSGYRSFFEGREVPHQYDKEELLGSEFAQEFLSHAQDEVGEYKYVKKGCWSALKELVKFRKTCYFEEDLDAFEGFLGEQLERLNDYKRDGFPVGDADLDKLDNKDLIMGGGYGTE